MKHNKRKQRKNAGQIQSGFCPYRLGPSRPYFPVFLSWFGGLGFAKHRPAAPVPWRGSWQAIRTARILPHARQVSGMAGVGFRVMEVEHRFFLAGYTALQAYIGKDPSLEALPGNVLEVGMDETPFEFWELHVVRIGCCPSAPSTGHKAPRDLGL